MDESELQGASLTSAQLQQANLDYARLQNASLWLAYLQGASLQFINGQGADFKESKPQGADMTAAKLQSAMMEAAQLQGTRIVDAQLQGENLNYVHLQGSDLRFTDLQGVSLEQAKLQGTDLRSAQLQGTNLWASQLTLSNISGAKFGKITEIELEKMLKLSETMVERWQKRSYRDTLLHAYNSTFSLEQAEGQNIWAEKPEKNVKKKFKKSKGQLEFANSRVDYENRLDNFRIDISCQDKWIAHGVIDILFGDVYEENVPARRFAHSFLSLKDKTNKLGQPVCPSVSEISKSDIKKLKRMSSTNETQNNIQATFKE